MEKVNATAVIIAAAIAGGIIRGVLHGIRRERVVLIPFAIPLAAVECAGFATGALFASQPLVTYFYPNTSEFFGDLTTEGIVITLAGLALTAVTFVLAWLSFGKAESHL